MHTDTIAPMLLCPVADVGPDAGQGAVEECARWAQPWQVVDYTTSHRVAGEGSHASRDDTSDSLLLSLPLELRLQVYYWVMLSRPLRESSPLPGYPVPEFKRHKTVREDASSDDFCCDALLCPDRPLHGMPSALLQVSRQVYAEAREVPFRNNEFVFRSWFSCGLSIAATFVGCVLESWQGGSMRFVRIEADVVDLLDDQGLQWWRRLSVACTNLQGLRLRVVVREQTNLERLRKDEGRTWVADGQVGRMKALEKVEMELDVPQWCSKEKVVWCDALQRSLDEASSSARVACTRWVDRA